MEEEQLNENKKQDENISKQRKYGIIESILFAASSKIIKPKDIALAMEITEEEALKLVLEMQQKYKENEEIGLEIVKINDGFTICSKKENKDYVYQVLDKRPKKNISRAGLEVLAIICYNKRATKNDIDSIRGVDSAGSIYKLLDLDLIKPAGKTDLPGKPMSYKVTDKFMQTFGIERLEDLPDLPKFKLDSNMQIVIDEK